VSFSSQPNYRSKTMDQRATHANYTFFLTTKQRTAATGKLVVQECVFSFAPRAHVRVLRCSRFRNIWPTSRRNRRTGMHGASPPFLTTIST